MKDIKELQEKYEELSKLKDEELNAVTGGFGYTYPNEDGSEFDNQFRFKVGDHAEYIDFSLPFIGTISTDGCTILHRSHSAQGKPVYQCEGLVDWNRNAWVYEFQFDD